MLNNIRVILVETSHAGNIGSAARAMKTMGLSNLCLVNPLAQLDAQAIALAAGADDVIEHATVVKTLDEALVGCRLVVGTSARSRTLPWPMLNPRECGHRMILESQLAPAALVFGRERVGLTNDELQKCHYHVAIPSNPDYSSLNLAMAVQILAYEIRIAGLAKPDDECPIDYPLTEDLEYFYQHLQQILLETGFIRSFRPGHVMSKLRRMFNRARLEEQELNMLRGILRSLKKTDSD